MKKFMIKQFSKKEFSEMVAKWVPATLKYNLIWKDVNSPKIVIEFDKNNQSVVDDLFTLVGVNLIEAKKAGKGANTPCDYQIMCNALGIEIPKRENEEEDKVEPKNEMFEDKLEFFLDESGAFRGQYNLLDATFHFTKDGDIETSYLPYSVQAFEDAIEDFKDAMEAENGLALLLYNNVKKYFY